MSNTGTEKEREREREREGKICGRKEGECFE